MFRTQYNRFAINPKWKSDIRARVTEDNFEARPCGTGKALRSVMRVMFAGREAA